MCVTSAHDDFHALSLSSFFFTSSAVMLRSSIVFFNLLVRDLISGLFGEYISEEVI